MRAFIAIDLPPPVRQSLASLQEQLKPSGADVKWVEPHNLHVTLKFLGEITQEQGRQVATLITQAASAQPPFDISLKSLGAFPSLDAPRVIWVGVEKGREAVVQLAVAIEQGCRALGFSGEERPFSAHVTLGRVRSPRRMRALSGALASVSWQPPAAWQVKEVVLYRSELGPEGPRYAALAGLPLGQ